MTKSYSDGNVKIININDTKENKKLKKLKTSFLLIIIAGGLVLTNMVSLAETTVENDELDKEIEAVTEETEKLQEEYTELTGEKVDMDKSLIAQEEAVQQQHQEELEQTFEALEAISTEIVELNDEIESAEKKGDETAAAQKEAQLKQKEEQEIKIASASMGLNVGQIDLSSMDLETALMEVQSQRAAHLEEQLQENLKIIQNRNERLSDLNEKLRKAQENGDTVLATELKGQIDTEMNSQQLEMFRLQSLSNKRNEAFDTMTNFIRKMQDSRSSIIGNMR